MPTYQIVSADMIKDDSGRFIPVDLLNADYQDYLAWVALGNTATNFSGPSNTDSVYVFGNLDVGNSEIYNGVSGRVLYDNNGVLGELATTGSGSVVRGTSPTIDGATLTGNLYAGSTPFEGNANDVLTSTGTGVEWNGSSGIGDVVRNITPTITDIILAGALGISGGGTGRPGQLLQATGTGSSATGITWADRSGKNAVINGDFAVGQRGTSFTSSTPFTNNDDAYTLDRWFILSDGNNRVEINQETSDLPGEQFDYQQTGCRMRVVTTSASAFKFGIAQIIEQRNCVGLIGKPVTLSFKLKASSTTKLDNIKAAIVQWTGTADAVTSDIVSTWNAEGTNPTLIANASYVNTPENLNNAGSWTGYDNTNAQPITGTVSSSAKNLIVFIWSDVTDTTAGDFIYLTDVQLEAGSVATAYERLPIDMSVDRCQRYCQLVETESNTGMGFAIVEGSAPSTTFSAFIRWYFTTPMRGTPSFVSNITATVTGAGAASGTSIALANFNTNANVNVSVGTTTITTQGSTRGAFIKFAIGPGTVTGTSNGNILSLRFTSSVRCVFDAEL